MVGNGTLTTKEVNMTRSKIIQHYKSFFLLGQIKLDEDDQLMIDWAESLLNKELSLNPAMTPEQFLQSKNIYSEAKVGADRKPSDPYKHYKIADLIREYIKLTKP
jgi:hypothetical protein